MTDIIVSSGVTSSNLTLNAGDTEEVLSGGSAYVSLLNVGATQTVAFGGTALYTNLSGGLENVAGLSIYTTLQDGNEGVFSVENVAAGGLASRTDVFGSSTLNVASGGFAVSSYVFGPGASDDILSGGSAQYTTAVQGGVENVFAQGSASFSIVSGGTQNVFGTTLEAVIAGTFVSPDLAPARPVADAGIRPEIPPVSSLQNVESGGLAVSSVISSGGFEDVLSGGVTIGTIVSGGGVETISSGGLASSTFVNYSGLETVLAGGSAISTTVQAGGEEDVLAGAAASFTVVSGGIQFVLGSASLATITGGGGGPSVVGDRPSAANGIVAEGAAPIQAGEQFVISGGVADHTTVLDSAVEFVGSGGTANKTTVYDGGSANIMSGGVANDAMLENGGYQFVSVSGIANRTTVGVDSYETVSSGGSSVSATVYGAGYELVGAGGHTTGTVIIGGTQVVSAGGVSESAVVSGGDNEVLSGGLDIGTTVSVGGLELVFSSGLAANITVDSGVASAFAGGMISGAVVNDGGLEQVEGTAINNTVSGGTLVVLAGGVASGTTLLGGSNLFVSAGGTATGVNTTTGNLVNDAGVVNLVSGDLLTTASLVPGGVLNIGSGGEVGMIAADGGVINVLSNATVSGAVFSGGGQFNHLFVDEAGASLSAVSVTGNFYVEVGAGNVANGLSVSGAEDDILGTAVNDVVGGGGQEYVYASGPTSGVTTATTVFGGGEQYVYSGGVTTGTTVFEEAAQYVYSSGVTTGTVAVGGGEQYVYSGGVADGTFVGSSSYQEISSGGVASNTDVGQHGAVYVYSGGSLVGAFVSSGGYAEILSGGSTTGTIVSGGGGGYEWLIGDGATTTTGTTVEAGGSSYVAVGVASATIVETGATEYVYSSGSTVGTIVSSGGLEYIYSSGSAFGTVVSSGGSEYLYSSGSAVNTIVSSGGFETLSGSDATTTGTTVEDGGAAYVITGTATATTIASGGTVSVFDSGVTFGATAETGGTLYANSGGSTNGTILLGGMEVVSGGGGALGTEIGLGGTQSVFGGSAVSTMINDGGTEVTALGGASYGATVGSGGTETVLAGGVASGTVVSGGGVLNDDAGGTADAVTAEGGTVNLSSGASLVGDNVDNGIFNLLSGYSQSALVLAGTGIVNVSAGAAVGATVTFDGTVNFLSGVVASGVTFTGGGQVDLASGASNVSAVMSNFAEIISGGATAVATSITNSEEVVLSGGSAVGTIVQQGLEVLDGGAALGSVVAGGGAQLILAGGAAIGATFIGSGSVQIVSSGGVANDTLVESGASQYVEFGTASGAVVEGGGFQHVSGGSVTGTVLSGGASIISSTGIAISTTIGTSGSLTLLSGGSASGGIIFAGNGAILAVAENSATTAPIDGFTFTDGIQLAGMQFSDTNTFTVSGNELIVTSGGVSDSFVIDGAQTDSFALIGFELTSALQPGVAGGAGLAALSTGPSGAGTGTEIILVPNAPVGLRLTSGSDSGIKGDDTTIVTTPVISGNGVAGDTIILYDSGSAVGSAVVGVDGVWSVETTALPIGANILTATQTNVTNDVSQASAPLTVTIVAPPPAPSAPVLAAGSDSGIQGDGVTDISTPAISGTGVDGDTVIIYNGQAAVGSAVVAGGIWAINTATLAPGNYSLTASQVDAYGNAVAAASPLPLAIVAPPAAPTLGLAPASDSGIQGDGVTDVATPTVTGTGTNGDLVTLYDGAVIIGSATVVAGSWAIATGALTPGAHALSATQTDSYGDASNPAALPLTIVAAPSAPTLALAPGSDSGIQGDGTTDIVTPTITGTGTTGDVVTLYDGEVALGSATVVGGAWAVTTSTLAPGNHNLKAVQSDSYGDATAAAARLPLVIVTAPAAPTLALAPASDSGVQGDGVTDVTAPTITGTGTDGDVVTLYNGPMALGSATVVGGTWSIAAGNLPPGMQTLSASETDSYGDASSPTTLPITIVAPPGTPTLALAPGSDSGIQGDGTTDIVTPTITGTGTNGDVVTLYDGEVALGSATVVGGAWAVTTSTLAPGNHNLRAVQSDSYGDTTAAAAALPVAIVAAPAAPTLALAPASDSGVQGDGVTDVTAPTITGTGTDGDVVTLYNGPMALGSATVVGGIWSIAAGNLPPGTQTLSASETDSYGDASSSTALPITIVAPPRTPTLALAPASDSGIQGDGITDVTAPTIAGTGITGDVVTLYNGATALGSATVVNGTWSIAAGTLAVGAQTLSATQTDSYGDASNAGALPITIVAPPPAPSAPVLAAGSDSGIQGDGITDLATPTVSGTGITGDTVVLYNGAVAVGSATVVNGQWAITATTLAPGNYSLTASQVDGYGDATAAATPLPLTIVATPVAPTLAVAPASDSGIQGDGITDVTAPTITGTGTTGDLITLYDGATAVGSATVVNGTWSIATGTLALGAQTLTATATDSYGDPSTSGTLPITIVAPPPAPSTPVLATGSDSGIQGDGATDIATPVISGTGVSGDTVILYDGAVAVGSAIVVDGNWAITTSTLTPGTYGLTASQVDGYGDATAAASPLPLTIVAAPGAPTLALAPGSDSGITGDGITDITAPTITGTGANGELIILYNGAVALGSATVVNGTWSIAAGTLGVGAQTLTATATDSYGDPSISGTLPITIVAPPPAPSAVLAAGSDSGIQGDGVTDVATPVISGTGVSGDTVILYNGAVAVGSAIVVDGSWAITATTLAPGTYGLTASQVDGYGDATAAPPVPITIVAAPDAPSAPSLAAASDTGNQGDSITNIVNPVISGTGIAGETVILYDGAVAVGSATVSDGSWSITTTTLTAGVHDLTAQQVDGYGDASAASGALALTIDITTVTDTSFVLGDYSAPLSVGIVTPTNPVYSAGQLAIAVAALPTNGSLTLADGTAVSVGEQLTSAQLTGLLFTPAAGSDSTSSLVYIVTSPANDTSTGTVAFTTGGTPIITTGSTIPNTSTPTISGVALANSAITLLENGVAIGTTTADASGAFSVVAGVPLTLGLDRLTVQDMLPNMAATNSAPLFVFDVEAPVAGVSTSDFASNDIGAAIAQGARLAFVGGTESVQLVDGTLSVGPDTGEATIQRLYEGLLGRGNDTGGISYYDAQLINGASENSIGAQFLTSPEYVAATGTISDTQFVASLYQGFLGRSAAADPGSSYWTDLLAGGTSRAAITIGVADSAEARTALGLTTDQVWVPHAPGTLAHELYETGLGREVELPALASINASWSVLTPPQLAAQIAGSPEFLADHAGQSNSDYVGSLYQNGLGRPVEAGGASYWSSLLNSGVASRSDVLLGIATSPEAQSHLTAYLGR